MAVWLDGCFWEGYFRSSFIPQIDAFCNAIMKRVIPVFANIAEEADDVAQSEYERYGSLPATGDESWDMGDAAEWAQEIGLAHYVALTGVRQSLVNLAVVALYHMFEQQLLLFHRKQVLHPSEEDNISKIKFRELQRRLKNGNLDIESLKSWAKVDELKLVANSIKHAEGTSADKLKGLRPDLFVNPYFREDDTQIFHPSRVYLPLAGKDIYVTIEDLEEYRIALTSFWDEFGNIVKVHSSK